MKIKKRIIKENWEGEVKKEFGNEVYEATFDVVWMIAKHDNLQFTEEVIWIIARHFHRFLSLQKQEVVEDIEKLITEEMLICHRENQPTSRLTSFLNKLKQTLTP